jgi:hypothetical protein
MTSRGFTHILIVAVIVATITSSCLRQDSQKGELPGVLAKVGDKRLVIEDLVEIYPQGISKEDSIKLQAIAIESWVKNQLKMKYAQNIKLNKSHKIDKQVEEYRNQLLIHQSEQFYINSHVDTTVTDSQVEFFYDNSTSEFTLMSPIIKYCFLRFPTDFRQGKKVVELFKSKKESDWLDLVDMADKNNLLLESFDSWTEVAYLKTLLPEEAKTSFSEFAGRKNNIYEISDKRYRYLVRVDQFIDAGNKRPLEQVKGVIRQMIIRQRAQNELKFLEDSLMQAAMKEGVIFVNQTIDKQTKK